MFDLVYSVVVDHFIVVYCGEQLYRFTDFVAILLLINTCIYMGNLLEIQPRRFSLIQPIYVSQIVYTYFENTC